MGENIERSLTELGLETKEARVYRTILELGPSPVQIVAQRTGIPRATTYVLLGALRGRGLVTTFEKGKKTFFVAESPEQLAQLVTGRAEEIRRQEQLLKSLLPTLKATGQFAGAARPAVRFYEGPEALKAFIRDNLQPGSKEVLNIYSRDDADRLLARARVEWDDLVKRRRRLGIRRRTIHAWRLRRPPTSGKPRDVAYVPYDQLPCTADITIIGSRVGLIPYDEPIRAVAIKDAAIAGALRAVFNALWEKYQKS